MREKPADKTMAKMAAENEELRAQLEEALETLRAIREGEVDSFVVPHAGGQEIRVLVSASESKKSSEEARLALLSVIEDQNAAVEALRKGEERFRMLFEQSPDGVLILDPETARPLEFNEAAHRQLGYSREEFARLSIADIDVDEAPEETEARIAGVVNKGCEDFDVRHRTREGEIRDVHVTAKIIELEERPHYLCVWRDITERKQAEEAIRNSEAKLRAVLDASPFPMALVDLEDKTILYWSRSATILFGHAAPTTQGWYELAYPNPEYRRQVVERWKPCVEKARTSGRSVNAGEYNVTCRDGSVRTCELYATFVGENMVVTFNDITERKQAEAALRDSEERLAQSKNLETIGLIAGGVAHEVRNPLFAITTIVTALEKKLHDQPEFGEYVEHIQDQTNRLNELMNDLLALGRRVDEERFAPCTLREIVESTLKAMEGAKPACRARLKIEWPKERLQLSGDQGKLVQVFQNILSNALALSPEESPIRVRAWPSEGMACLSITDAGPGIPAEMMAKLFEPFASRRKGGTGLGLAIVHKIVEAHGGTVEGVNNDPPPGATFTVRLPLASKETGGGM